MNKVMTLGVAAGLLFSVSACGSDSASLSPADSCAKIAYDDWRVIKDQNFTKPPGERTATKIIAREEFAKKVRECEIRNGDTGAIVTKWRADVANDDSW